MTGNAESQSQATMVKDPHAAPARKSSEAKPWMGLKGPVGAGCLAIVLFFGAFGGWAALAPLDLASEPA